MSYNKTVWHPRDIITAEKMQKIENQLETLSTGNNASFSPIVTNPQDGDTLVYNAAQQKWVNGAGAGGVMIVHIDNETGILDKTWKEIKEAFQNSLVLMVFDSGTTEFTNCICIRISHLIKYMVVFWILDASEQIIFEADTEDDYPQIAQEGDEGDSKT